MNVTGFYPVRPDLISHLAKLCHLQIRLIRPVCFQRQHYVLFRDDATAFAFMQIHIKTIKQVFEPLELEGLMVIDLLVQRVFMKKRKG